MFARHDSEQNDAQDQWMWDFQNVSEHVYIGPEAVAIFNLVNND